MMLGERGMLLCGFLTQDINIPTVSFDRLRTNGWDVEGLSPNGSLVTLFLSHRTN